MTGPEIVAVDDDSTEILYPESSMKYSIDTDTDTDTDINHESYKNDDDDNDDDNDWYHVELVQLYNLYRKGRTLKEIAYIFDKSLHECKTALKRIVTQQALHNTLNVVNAHYGKARMPNILDYNYYVPLVDVSPVERSWLDVPFEIFVFSAFVFLLSSFAPYVRLQ